MMDGIDVTSSVANAFPNVASSNTDGSKNHEGVSDVQAEETSNVDSAREANRSEEAANAQAKETSHEESAQRGHEANEKPLAAQNESRATMLDVLG